MCRPCTIRPQTILQIATDNRRVKTSLDRANPSKHIPGDTSFLDSHPAWQLMASWNDIYNPGYITLNGNLLRDHKWIDVPSVKIFLAENASDNPPVASATRQPTDQELVYGLGSLTPIGRGCCVIGCGGYSTRFKVTDLKHSSLSISDHVDENIIARLLAGQSLADGDKKDTASCSQFVKSGAGLKRKFCPRLHIENRLLMRSKTSQHECDATRTITTSHSTPPFQRPSLSTSTMKHNFPIPVNDFRTLVRPPDFQRLQDVVYIDSKDPSARFPRSLTVSAREKKFKDIKLSIVNLCTAEGPVAMEEFLVLNICAQTTDLFLEDTGELAPEDGINETRLLALDSAMEIEDVAREGAREVAGVEFLIKSKINPDIRILQTKEWMANIWSAKSRVTGIVDIREN
ncbi:hypothetical protein B0H19DRAFT_1058235 [Mycena capillaripes]|nr:hypothetical protein B0H19DRAFT_1058235 [Mycena capillaripes]